jgi:phosphoenolpyruvate carboxykinase (GTP)
VFGGRRGSVVPLVHESFSWEHGVFMGSIASSEMTAAAFGKVGQLRRDPFAMLPFCGYHMGDYFKHWLSMPDRTDRSKLPRIFYVNWFRKDANGRFAWPGYGENSRVIKWIFERVSGTGKAVETPIGYLPTPDALDVTGLNVSAENLADILRVDVDAWKGEYAGIKEHYATFGDRLPKQLADQLEAMCARLQAAST